MEVLYPPLIAAVAVAVMFAYCAGLYNLGASTGFIVVLATLAALVFFWPLGLLFMLATCCMSIHNPAKQSSARDLQPTQPRRL